MMQIHLWLFTALFWIGALMFLFGVILLLAPGLILGLSRPLNRWIDTDPLFRKLDDQQHFERFFYRHHLLMGVLITTGALYCLHFFVFVLNRAEVFRQLPVISSAPVSEWIYGALALFLLVANLVALMVGIIVIVRPSLLKGVEAWANRWIASDRVLKRLDTRTDLADRVIPRRPRLFAVLVIIGSLYIVSNTMVVALR
jgi:hypothetical protein